MMDSAQGATTPVASAGSEGMSTLTKVLIVIGVVSVLFMGSCAACVWYVGSVVSDVAEDFEANPAKATAELAVRMNPDLELVDSDDEAGTITVRSSGTGEEITVDFSEIAAGNFSFTTDEGEVSVRADEGGVTATAADGAVTSLGRATLDDLQDWVLRYPGADYAGGNVVVDTDGLSVGAFVLLTDDSATDVFAYYEEHLRAAGYKVTRQTTGEGVSGGASGILMGRLESSGRTFNVIVSEQDGRTHINTQFQDRSE